MTIDEAVKHIEEQKEIFGGTHGEFLEDVSKWLKELEHYKLGDCMNDCEHYDNCTNYVYSKGYNAAIDEFVDKIYDVSDFVREPSLISGGYSVATLENIEKIAEQMKTE